MDTVSVRRYRAVCDHVLAQWRLRHPATQTTNIAWLTEPAYWHDDPSGLRALLEFVASDRVAGLLETLGGAPPLFNNTQYFFEPVARNWDGAWHRDCQFLVSPSADEASLRARFRGVHFRVAFCDDDNLHYVPGSHLRDDTPAEREVRDSGNAGELADGRIIALRAGDAAVFDAWGIHRGRYRAGVARRTFDVVLQWGPPQMEVPPPPTCFTDAELYAGLSVSARRFYSRFVEAYRNCWAHGRHILPDL